MANYNTNYSCSHLEYMKDIRKTRNQIRGGVYASRDSLGTIDDGMYTMRDTIDEVGDYSQAGDMISNTGYSMINQQAGMNNSIYNDVQCMQAISSNCASALYDKLANGASGISDAISNVLDYLNLDNSVMKNLGALASNLLNYQNMLNNLNMNKLFRAFDDLLNCQTSSAQQLPDDILDELDSYMEEISSYSDELGLNDSYEFDKENFLSNKFDEYFNDIQEFDFKETFNSGLLQTEEAMTSLTEYYQLNAGLSLDEINPETLKLPPSYI